MSRSLIEESFEPPRVLETEHVRLEPLSTTHNALDHAAVMASAERLRTRTAGRWPSVGFELDENFADLDRHEREHRDGIAFTFTVLDRADGRCLGCVYLRPASRLIERATVTEGVLTPEGITLDYWLVPDAEGLEGELLTALRSWLTDDWPFSRVDFTTTEGETAQRRLFEERLAPSFVAEGEVVVFGFR
ncbi:MAG: N-acetyltransferase [Planctomycetes bacterium]|nr:N-acetyltransferase [Planctomycetota bacterium]